MNFIYIAKNWVPVLKDVALGFCLLFTCIFCIFLFNGKEEGFRYAYIALALLALSFLFQFIETWLGKK